MSFIANTHNALSARTWQDLALPMGSDAFSHDEEQSRMGAADGKVLAASRMMVERKMTLALELYSSIKAEGSGGQQVSKEADADLHVFDDARLAIRQHTRAQHNLLDQWELALLEKLASSKAEAKPQIDLGGASFTANGVSDAESDSDLQGLIDIIRAGKTDIDAYAGIVEGLTKYFQSVADVMSKIQDYISAADKNNMQIDGGSIKKLISDAISNLPVMHLPAGANVDQWRKELGDVVSIGDDGTVEINPSKLNNMLNSLPDGTVKWDTAKYQAWNTGFSQQKDNIQNDVQTIVEKYSHQNSNFDNLVKVLSGFISTQMDTAKSYLQI
ncbi:type III secretion system needle tip protein SctA [Burkholderia ubonensis]|uniref:type III secretion system needle tip protein SctA n=1 Tax=Burkholderia ubonensis TaxID=101571 RepID=UPI00075D54A0|nr:type III secretion system needle tip protein SctA [Burkholderia ubonensis]KWK77681.1 hypothetical protein WM15_26730 [Burkholderia ubonensis]